MISTSCSVHISLFREDNIRVVVLLKPEDGACVLHVCAFPSLESVYSLQLSSHTAIATCLSFQVIFLPDQRFYVRNYVFQQSVVIRRNSSVLFHFAFQETILFVVEGICENSECVFIFSKCTCDFTFSLCDFSVPTFNVDFSAL